MALGNFRNFENFEFFGRRNQFLRQDSIRIIQTWLDLTYSDIIHAKITKNKKKFLPFFPFNGCTGLQIEAKGITLEKSPY